MFFIIGEQTVKTRVKDGMYLLKYCPKCNSTTRMYESSMRDYFTLFFIPLFPVEKGESVLTCPGCNTSYIMQEEDIRRYTRKGNLIRMYPK